MIGPGATMVARLVASIVLVPTVSAAVVAMPMSFALTRLEGMLVRFFISAAIVGRVPPDPAADQPVTLQRSICTGTPAAKNVVVTHAESLISLITHRRVASFQRNWKISLLPASAAGRMPVNPP